MPIQITCEEAYIMIHQGSESLKSGHFDYSKRGYKGVGGSTLPPLALKCPFLGPHDVLFGPVGAATDRGTRSFLSLVSRNPNCQSKKVLFFPTGLYVF